MFESLEIFGCLIDALLAMWFISKFVAGKIENKILFSSFVILHMLFNLANSFGVFTLQTELNSAINVGFILVYSFLPITFGSYSSSRMSHYQT